jgi:hypothetical protein
MPIYMDIYQGIDYTCFTCGGELTYDEIRTALETYYRQQIGKVTRHVIWDVRNATVRNLIDEEADAIIDLVKGHAALREGARVAFIVPDQLDFRLIAMYTDRLGELPFSLKAHRSKDEALQWLAEYEADR